MCKRERRILQDLVLQSFAWEGLEELRDLAFGNMVAMIVDLVNIRATCASALPTHSRSSWEPQ